MFYEVLVSQIDNGYVFLAADLYQSYYKDSTEKIYIKAGSQKLKVNLVPVPGLAKNLLEISKDILEKLGIPENLQYQIKFYDNIIELGPVVGLLMAKTKASLRKKMHSLKEYTVMYGAFQGLLYAFSREGIDYSTNQVQGLYFRPGKGKKPGEWIKGIFPLPGSIYRRITLPRYQAKKLKIATNNRMFNSYYFNKWTFWQMGSKIENLRSHLPTTKRLLSLDDLDSMLEKYKEVYLKPVSGTLAKGLIRVYQRRSYFFQENDREEPLEIRSRAVAEKYINKLISQQEYLVQQAIDSLKVQKRYVDFRVIMQKDHTQQWHCTAIIGRIGKVGGICSNFMEWGYACTADEVLSNFILDEEILTQKRNEIIAISKKACAMLDAMPENFGDVGLDVVVDKKLGIWILEVNKMHDHSLVNSIHDSVKYQAVKTNPIYYAVRLSGFRVNEKGEST